jgi:nicotinamide-nucleotide amidase
VRVAIVAVGSELLGGERRDTNGDWIVERIERAGGRVDLRVLCADDAGLLRSVVEAAAQTHDLLVLTGGLGPTEDDRTREALSAALGRPLVRDSAVEETIERAFRSRGYRFRASHARQAMRPEGTRGIENPVGSAPGIGARLGACEIVALPGVPAELRAMFDAAIVPLLATTRGRVARRTLKVAGRTESSVDEALADLYRRPGVDVTILASSGIVELRLRAEGKDEGEASAILAGVDAEMTSRLGDDLFGRDDETLASAVGRLLRDAGRTVAVAESCTGGGIGAAMTSVPGSSAWFRGGAVVYADDLKTAIVGVPAGTIAREGAVSATVARLLAEGARERFGSDYGIGATGIAGPTGGSPEKPVGLVFVAVAGGGETRVREMRLPGDRELVRARAVHAACDELRRVLLDRPPARDR